MLSNKKVKFIYIYLYYVYNLNSMNLSESYKKKITSLAGLTLESKEKNTEYEYQLRDIDGPTFYKRKKESDKWQFVSAKEFAEGLANGSKLIKWEQKEK